MKRKKAESPRFKVSSEEALKMILRYIKIKVLEQIKSVSGIIIYLILFQTIILGIPILHASVIGMGLVMVILGLSFFMEGLLLGIMPMGEEIGIRLPQRAKFGSILFIGFILGVVATFAEPAIGVLKVAGSSVLAWKAPLLFLLLNKYSVYLVAAIAIGVGGALILSMFRFFKGWSLKPFIYVLVSILLALSLYSSFHPNLQHILGLAWDSGGVTTGPVTVPLVLALGIGISHVANKGASSVEGGFGVVTMASLVPVIAVLVLGLLVNHVVPNPTSDVKFFDSQNSKAQHLFHSNEEMQEYALGKASFQAQLKAFDNDKAALMAHVSELGKEPANIRRVFGSKDHFRTWLIQNGNQELKEQFAEMLLIDSSTGKNGEGGLEDMNIRDYSLKNLLAALRAIVPLSLFLLGILYIVLRESLGRPDEVYLGLVFAVIGMALFGGGIELGLSRIGDQVGSNLPVSFAQMQNTSQQKIIKDFSLDNVYNYVRPDGSSNEFFYFEEEAGKISPVQFEAHNYDDSQKLYRHIPMRGPLFGRGAYSALGILVVLVFAFILGYTATLAEPALNALGLTVEDVTVGAFRKSSLIQAVAIGVGTGISLGITQIIWNIPLFWLLCPLYLVLFFITKFSTEEFVSIGWDSAGVTTGPITVPLVLSMGLGIGSQVGVEQGFGILATASVCPIISVLSMGLVVNYRRRALIQEAPKENLEIAAATEEASL
ncbi:MAG: DUF1538 domain-containing protein [Candidatus Cloacimonetes bacterium]|nr:DUF1538 domain-containing protein [Candidatus Cloacimonadota bacterium]